MSAPEIHSGGGTDEEQTQDHDDPPDGWSNHGGHDGGDTGHGQPRAGTGEFRARRNHRHRAQGDENLQDTPIAITALTGDALDDRQVFSTDVLDQVVPNLQFGNNAPLAGNNSSSQVFIRGIGQTDPTSTVDPGVGLYIDDVYIGTAVGGTMELRDIDSVQVLRGPQGTLFGRNTIGGAILISTKDPGDEFGGTVRAGLGTDKLLDGVRRARRAVLGQLSRRAFAFGMRKQDGYVTRTDGTDLGDTNTFTRHDEVAVGRPPSRFKATRRVRLHQGRRKRQPAGIRGDQRSGDLPARRQRGCRLPGRQRLFRGLRQPVPMLADDRCANDLQARGPFRNNGTLH